MEAAAGITRRGWLIAVLLIFAVLVLSGCTGGVLDTTIAWISGLVTKSRGEPIPSATVTLAETGQSTTTDSEGRFALGTEFRGTGTLRAEAGGYLTLKWPVSIPSSEISDLRLRLVTMADFNAALFGELTGASNTVGTWRWDQPTVTYYIDRTGAYRPEFDAPLREGFELWSMLTQREVSFVEGGPTSAIQITYVSSKPCGVTQAAACAGVTAVSAQGRVRGAILEFHAGYAANVGLVIHEVGHTLAFTGHSSTSTDVMYQIVNGSTSPSNAEAAAAAVLYANPPGTKLQLVQLPAAQQPAAQVLPSTLPAAALATSTLPAARLPEPGTQAPPEPIYFRALDSIALMVRNWFAGPGCLINLPLFCTGSGARIW